MSSRLFREATEYTLTIQDDSAPVVRDRRINEDGGFPLTGPAVDVLALASK
jgi:hypothetical protein